MTKGKTICNVLKGIRKSIADANGIEYSPRKCHHEGECRGTCPACEAEVRYIERQLNVRRQLGKAVTIVGLSAGIAALTGCGSGGGHLAQPSGMMIPPEPTEQVFGDVDQLQIASFRGGQKALMEWIENNTNYPDDECHSGRVVVTFTINKDGSISDAKVVKSVCPELDKEALRVVNAMPKWYPAKNNGQSVKTKYSVPITFSPK